MTGTDSPQGHSRGTVENASLSSSMSSSSKKNHSKHSSLRDDLAVSIAVDDEAIIHAGEHLRAIVTIRNQSDAEQVILLCTMRLICEMLVDNRVIDANALSSALRHSRPAVVGGGTILLPNAADADGAASKTLSNKAETETAADDGGHWRKLTILCTPPSLLFAGDSLLIDQDYCCTQDRYYDEWIMRLPVEIPPSYYGCAMRINYRLEVTVQGAGDGLTGLAGFREECPIRVLPAFCAQVTQGVPRPFRRYSLTMIDGIGGPAVAQCRPFTLSQSQPNQSSALIRCAEDWIKAGLPWPPTMEDILNHPLHPIASQMIRVKDEESPTQAARFNNLSLDSPGGATFKLQHKHNEVATVRISKSLLRLGEELTCIITFPQSSPSVLTPIQLVAHLEYTETLLPSGSPFIRKTTAQSKQIFRKVECECLRHSSLSFTLSLPSDANSTFYADLLESRWTLSLAIHCHAPDTINAANNNTKMLVTVMGDIPLIVLPSLAVNLSTIRFAAKVR